MATMIKLDNGQTLNLTSARAELKLKAEHLSEMVDAQRSTTLNLGRYLVSVRDSGLGQAALTATELKDGRTNGFSVWYSGLGYDTQEVSQWIRYAETVDGSPIDLSALSQGAALAFATADTDDHAEILEGADTLSAASIRDSRKTVEAANAPDPGPSVTDDDDDDDDIEPTHLDEIVDDIDSLDPMTTLSIHTTDDLQGAINTLQGFLNTLA